MKRVTIKDVAERAGVSYGTVSRALSDHPEISEATKRRIRDLCEEMGYVPNMAARGLVKQSTQVIGLIVPDVSNPFFSEIALEIEMTARAKGYHILVCNTTRSTEWEYEAAEQLLRQQIDGLIISPVTPESMTRVQELCGSLPLVCMGDNHNGGCTYVSNDNVRGGYIGGRYLTQLGHRQIAFIGGRTTSNTNRLRTEGFRRAMAEAGCEGIVVECPPEMDDNRRYNELARQFLADRPPVTAIFSYSDRFALGVMQAAGELGLRIPEDLSLLGYDNIAYASLPRINLTSISHHKRTLGRMAVNRLIARIEGDTAEYHDILEPELIIRGTCRGIRSSL